MCNKVYNSFSFGHFLVGLIEHELYLGLFFLLSHLLNLAGQKLIIPIVTPHVSKPHDYVNHMFMRP
jgi:hypothetical protein